MAMTAEERSEFLAGPHVAVLSVASGSERGPLTTPVWYLYRPGGDVLLYTGRTSRKGRLIERAGRFTLTVQSTSPNYRYAAVEGPAEFFDITPELVKEVTARYVPPEAVDGYAEQMLASRKDLVAVRLTPERWNAADMGPA
ncbi:pyridoxamine 5'-phosphate oxidase family protein [Streptomyces sp. MST-110588]|uniref:pyridoxamine 5'-phosphate oxidase family protein n=1 Tax=Streptomyces sp. MST-110588 TaxID=2833628 RepID=UPI001F5D2115|nr:pyridoxamine 5'-phosphate oxidase family protein [Streptomyces sp. MST-110588]UNO41498.1 pyridoxamine 5'-phosphate oxidase family protein [Streptomyces sp. MST-110588]